MTTPTPNVLPSTDEDSVSELPMLRNGRWHARERPCEMPERIACDAELIPFRSLHRQPHPRHTLHNRLHLRLHTRLHKRASIQVIPCHRPAHGPDLAVPTRVARTRRICGVCQRKAAGVIL